MASPLTLTASIPPHSNPYPLPTSKKKMASPLTDIPDHLLAEIFLRLPDPADLARASAACVPFRRLATQASFLRAFRRRHAPLHLGILNIDGFHPALPPHPSAPAARALALDADFSFSFLPSSRRHWMKRDIRDGRVLLSRATEGYGYENPFFPELVVCDPLRRRYVLLPLVPDDLAALVEQPLPHPFLAPLSEHDPAVTEKASFRVICLVRGKTKLAAFVFSSSIGQWQAAASKACGDLGLDTGDSDKISQIHPLRRHYAYGCFYWDWLVIKRNLLLVLDTRRMEFSVAALPPGEWSTKGVAIVEAGEGGLGMFGLHGENEFASHLSYTILRNRGKSPSQWLMKKTISLDPGYQYYIKAATERCLLLMRTDWRLGSPLEPRLEYFSMDIKTLQLQRVCAKRCNLMLSETIIHTYLSQTGIYTNFPSSLLPPQTV
ncbi:hypothetical protein ACQJBY_039649 [Aegilops geniculata]